MISVRGMQGDTGEQCDRGAERAHVIIVRGEADDQLIGGVGGTQVFRVTGV